MRTTGRIPPGNLNINAKRRNLSGKRSYQIRPIRYTIRRRGLPPHCQPEDRPGVCATACRPRSRPCPSTNPVGADIAPSLAKPTRTAGVCRAGNRWCILPMEGWDGTLDGRPAELTTPALAPLRGERRQGDLGRRGRRRPPGRPGQPQPTGHQREDTSATWRAAQSAVRRAPRAVRRAPTIVLVGLQLTHSGRYSRPTTARPRAADRLPPSGARSRASASRRPRRSSPTTSSTPGRRLPGRGAPGAGGRLRLRRRQALSRLSRTRAAERARRARAGTAVARGRTRFLRRDRRRASAPRRRGSGSASGCRPSTWCRSGKGVDDVGEPEADDDGYSSRLRLHARSAPPAIDRRCRRVADATCRRSASTGCA